jgi:hypothetical protein
MRIKPICFFIFAITIACLTSHTIVNAQSMDESVAIVAELIGVVFVGIAV